MAWIRWTVLVAAALLALVWALGAWGSYRWSAATQALEQRLAGTFQPVQPGRVDLSRELEGLPPTVQRFFRAALTDGQPMVASARMAHRGSFNLAADGPDQWKPFRSRQVVSMRRPGFVWDGEVDMVIGVSAHVHDAYVGGEGILVPAVMGLFKLTEMRGSAPEIGGVAHGEFLRWLAESAWYPTVLLPSQGVRWDAVDDQAARATVSDGEITGTLLFRFDPASGLVASVRAEARGRVTGGRVELTPWEGQWSGYAQQGPMRVPMQGQVAWVTPQGLKTYWRGEVVTLDYGFAGAP
jgi:hypothetical protein